MANMYDCKCCRKLFNFPPAVDERLEEHTDVAFYSLLLHGIDDQRSLGSDEALTSPPPSSPPPATLPELSSPPCAYRYRPSHEK